VARLYLLYFSRKPLIDYSYRMDDPPSGYRDEKEAHLYRMHGTDPAIVPDRVSPAVEGYFRIPAIWVGEEPDPASVRVLNLSIHHARVLRKVLRCGIIAHVQRDGTFLFDFRDWPLAPVVIIPGYRAPQPHHRPPLEHIKAEELAESYAVLRAQVMNAHQACLTTAESVIKRRVAMMGFPVTAWNTEKTLTWDTPRAYHNDSEDTHALARNVLNNKDMIASQQPLGRRVIELEVVEYSLELLDQILTGGDAVLVQIVEAVYIAACRQREKRFGEAVTLGWGVCEQLISAEWDKMLDELRTDAADAERMPKDRRAKLKSRDYTASVMVEMLEVNGRLDRELYRLLEIARKARNYWAHEMRVPKERESSICLRAATQLLRRVKRIDLSLQSGGRGGVPEWPVWMWETVKERR
jgi:hypothetical protein